MSASKFASVIALLGGVVWVVAGVLTWGDADSRGALYWAGLAGLLIALAFGGYALVAKAPIWLRLVVTLATAALGYMVWVLIVDGINEDYVSVLGGGVLLLVGGVTGLLRGRRRLSEAPGAPTGGHRVGH